MDYAHGLHNAALKDQYLQAGFSGRVGWGARPALLVIDMARAWTDSREQIGSDLGNVLSSIDQLLSAARARDDVPVIFTTMAYAADFSDLSLPTRLKTPHSEKMLRGSDRVQLLESLGRRPSEPVVEKPRASAFFNTNLIRLLVPHAIDTLIITGCSTSGCIRATCESAIDLGYRGIVPQEAVGDRSASAHTASLFDIDARYADVMPLAEVLSHLAGGA